MTLFPIMLKLQGRKVLVVGGGPVGLRKVRALVRAGAQVCLIIPDETPCGLEGVRIIRRAYHPKHLDGMVLVFACTDDRATNAQIAADARRRGLWACAVDQPEDCDFFTPAVRRAGPVVVAVATDGQSPGLAGRLCDDLAEHLPAQIGAFAECLGDLRRQWQRDVSDPVRRTAMLRGLASQEAYERFLAEGPAGVAKLAETLAAQPAEDE